MGESRVIVKSDGLAEGRMDPAEHNEHDGYGLGGSFSGEPCGEANGILATLACLRLKSGRLIQKKKPKSFAKICGDESGGAPPTLVD